MVTVRIEYVDGEIREFPADRWADERADGVYLMIVDRTTFMGYSAYWLYREEYAWVAGAASFGYDEEFSPEIIYYDGGEQEARWFLYVPDLKHDVIKLGWWR